MTALYGVRLAHGARASHQDHPEIMERPHAKIGSDPLKTVADFGQQRTGTNQHIRVDGVSGCRERPGYYVFAGRLEPWSWRARVLYCIVYRDLGVEPPAVV